MKKISKIFNLLKKISKNKKGFSLTELMVATSIVGTMATMTAAQMNDVIASARDAQRKANVKQVYTALNLYSLDNYQYPICDHSEASSDCWNIVTEALEAGQNMYMPEVPVDPLNEDNYVFKYWSDGNTFRIEYETEDDNDVSPNKLIGA